MGSVSCIGAKRSAYRFLVRKAEGDRSPGNLGVDVRTILKRILKKYNGSVNWCDVADFCVHGNEASGSITFLGFLD